MIQALKQFWWFITLRCYMCGRRLKGEFFGPHCPCWFRRS